MNPNEVRARLASSGGWGEVGSDDMPRYANSAPNKRKHCHCGCGGALTHYGMANGVALMGGCELSVRRWVKSDTRNRHDFDPITEEER